MHHIKSDRQAARSDGDRTVSHQSVVAGLRWHSRVPDRQPAPEATPIVLVHGLAVSGRYMVPLMRCLAGEFDVVAPDLPGFGTSVKPAQPLTLPQLADGLAAWMEHNGMPRAALIGNSLGCQIIAHLAQRHPARITRVVLIAPTMDPSAPKAWQQLARLVADAPRERPSLLRIAIGDYLRAGPRWAWSTLRDAMRDRAGEQYQRIDKPALVVRGSRDPVVSAAWADDVARLLPFGRCLTIDGAPHAVNFSAPAALTSAIRPFLAEDR